MAMLTRGAAVTPGSPQKALQRFQNYISAFWPAIGSGGVLRKSTHVDPIDCFTNELVERKSKKWDEFRGNFMKKSESESLNVPKTKKVVNNDVVVPTPSCSFSQNIGLMSKAVITDFNSLRSPELGLDIRSLSKAQLDNLLTSTLEIKNKVDFLYLVRQCIRWQKLPSDEVLISCLKYLSSLSRTQQIESFAEICRKLNHPLSQMYCDLAPFKAMAQWRSGGADMALSTLFQGYEYSSSNEGKRMIRAAFRTIAEETLAKKSEAVLVYLMEVARSIYDKHRDIFVVACIWKQCFQSEWFCDQKTAADLLLHYEELQQLVAKRY